MIHTKGNLNVPYGEISCGLDYYSTIHPALDSSIFCSKPLYELVYKVPPDFQCDDFLIVKLEKTKYFGEGSSFWYPFDSYFWQFIYTKNKQISSTIRIDYSTYSQRLEIAQIVYFNDSCIATKVYNLNKELQVGEKIFLINESRGSDYIGLINIKTSIRSIFSWDIILFLIYLIILVIILFFGVYQNKVWIKKLGVSFLIPILLWVLSFLVIKPIGFNLFNILAGIDILIGFYISLKENLDKGRKRKLYK